MVEQCKDTKCVIAGTLVLCQDEKGEEIQKPIEEVEVGDLVWAYDEETGESDWKPVVRLFRNTTKEWYHIKVNEEEIICTGEHPFYVEGRGFVFAKYLKINDKLLQNSGEYATIKEIKIQKLVKDEITYNFEVADFHTYYVSDLNILVHNDCGFDEFVKNPESIWGKSADEVGEILGDGWTRGSYGSKGTGWKFTKGDKMIAYHPGGGIHKGSYYKISSGAIGKIKVVGPAYVKLPGDKAIIIKVSGGLLNE